MGPHPSLEYGIICIRVNYDGQCRVRVRLGLHIHHLDMV